MLILLSDLLLLLLHDSHKKIIPMINRPRESPETNLVDVTNFSLRNLGPLWSRYPQF